MSEITNNYFNQIANLITQAKYNAEIAINSELVVLYWNVGKVIKEQILDGNKPEYGKSVLLDLAKELTNEYGRGYGKTNLFNMVKLYEVFADEQKFHTLCGKLTWSHFRKLMHLTDENKRDFYTTLAINERWSVRELEGRIDSQLYERTNLSKKPELTIANDIELLRTEKQMTKDLVLRDPYLLDFLELQDSFSEKDLESAIIAELERFLLEMGRDFTFVGRQVRISFEKRDYYIDLLLYHRKLKCLVVVELKLGEFKPEYKGQVELYLNYLEKYEMNEGENPPIGIILCSSKEAELVELMKLDESRIHVAEFITTQLTAKLPQAISNAKTLLHQRKTAEEDNNNGQ